MKLEDAEAGHQKTAEERDMLKQQLNESEEKYGMFQENLLWDFDFH